jgi:hypothetical protein
MDFSINLTLLVQAINFMIALIVLTKFFLEPAIAELSKEDEDKKQLRQAIVASQDLLRQKKESTFAQTQEWQKQLYAEQPPVGDNQQVRLFSFPETEKREAHLSNEAVTALARSIVQKVTSP